MPFRSGHRNRGLETPPTNSAPSYKPCCLRLRVEHVGEEGVDKLVGVERRKVFVAFAEADVLHRETHLLADRDDDAPLRSAVELRQDDACAAGCLSELARLADAVLA